MKLSDQLYGEKGQFKVQGRTISEAEAHEKFEWISLKKIIQVSSNVGAAKLALKLGADRYLAALKDFGFGAKSGLEFPGEISGRMPPRAGWKPLALANIGFGQGVLVTPLQITRAYAAFANGGLLVQPVLLADPALPAREPRRVLAPEIAAQVVEALESVTDKDGGGTGAKAVLARLSRGGQDRHRAEDRPRDGRLLALEVCGLVRRIPARGRAQGGDLRVDRRAPRDLLRR